MTSIDEKDYYSLLSDGEDKLIYFSAPWCVACRAFGPMLEDLAAGTKLPLYKVDASEHAELAIAAGVQSLPTTLALLGGEKKVAIGAFSRKKTRELLGI